MGDLDDESQTVRPRQTAGEIVRPVWRDGNSQRLDGIEGYYEEAARDLYADGRQAFWHVTLPMLLPGIMAGFMLAFIISLDDFIITNFVAGPGSTTLPLAIYGLVRTGLTPEINAISTMLLLVSIFFVTLSFIIGRKKLETND